MSNPQFNSQEELEAYLAEQSQRREYKKRGNVALWKTGPMILGAFVIGFVVMFAYPNTDLNAKKNRGGTSESRMERVNTVLSWLGVDVEKRKREHQNFVDDLNSNRAEFGDTSWSMSELPQLFE